MADSPSVGQQHRPRRQPCSRECACARRDRKCASRDSAAPSRPARCRHPRLSLPTCARAGPRRCPVPAPWAGVGRRVPGSRCPPCAQPSPPARGFREVHWGRDVLSLHLLIQLFMAISVGSPIFIFAYGFHPRTSLLCSLIFMYCIDCRNNSMPSLVCCF